MRSILLITLSFLIASCSQKSVPEQSKEIAQDEQIQTKETPEPKESEAIPTPNPVTESKPLYATVDTEQPEVYVTVAPPPSLIQLEVDGHQIDDSDITLYMKIVNNSSSYLSILKPTPLQYRKRSIPAIRPPDFFSIALQSDQNPCIISAPADAGGVYIKSKQDILKVEPYSSAKFNIALKDYDIYYCDDEVFDLQIDYSYDDRLLDWTYFIEKIAQRGQLTEDEAQELYLELNYTYPGDLSTTYRITR